MTVIEEFRDRATGEVIAFDADYVAAVMDGGWDRFGNNRTLVYFVDGDGLPRKDANPVLLTAHVSDVIAAVKAGQTPGRVPS